MVDMSIPNRFEIGLSKEIVSGVIFGVEYLILPFVSIAVLAQRFCM